MVLCLRVIDGDTIIIEDVRMGLLKGKLRYRVRLSYIDAPEINQHSFDNYPIGKNSVRFLKKEIEGKKIEITIKGIDKYKRLLGQIWNKNQEDINLKIIKQGHAVLYLYAKFSHSFEKFIYLQSFYYAKIKRKGIWNYKGFLNPYNFRKLKK